MSGKYIPIINKGEISKVYIEDVLLIEQELRKTLIYTEDDKFWCYGKMDELSKFLDNRFFRCHQSCIINMSKVIKMKEQTVFFENGFKIMMGKEKFKFAKQNFARHVINGAN